MLGLKSRKKLQYNLLKIIKKTKIIVLNNKAFLATFVALFVVYFSWWLAFFPGIMTSDSFDMWKEAITFHFINANPFLYALTMSTLRVFNNTPAPMALFQIILLSTIIATFVNYSWKKGINKLFIILTVIFFMLWPQFGIYNVTIWKDVMYSIFTLALGLATAVFIVDGNFRKNNKYFWLIASFSALVALFRFNGFIFLFLPALLFLIFKILDIRRAAVLFASTLGIFIFVSVVLSGALRVQQVPAMSEGLMIKAVGGIYSLGRPNLNEFERSSFKEFTSEENWKGLYDCKSANALVYSVMKKNNTNSYSPALNADPVKDSNFKKAFISAVLKNPKGIIKDRICLADNLVGFSEVNYFRYADTISRGAWHPLVVEDSKLPGLKTELKNYLKWTTSSKLKSDLFWATWPMLIILSGAFILSVYKKYLGLGIYSLFVLLNFGTAVALVPAIDYRYVYFVYVCTPFIPIVFFLEVMARKKKTKKVL